MSAVTARDRLLDIQDAITAIERYTDGGRDRFDSDELVRVWCIRHIEIIGEAVSTLPKSLCAAYPEAPWRDIVGMRNVLIHGYRKVSDERIWSVVEHHLAPLRETIERMLADLPPD